MSAPEIRSFQFGGSNVNLFRGDVNTSMTLVSLPSRSNLDVEVKLSYRSNVHDQATLWNLEAPTGVVGLGWSLSYERIQLASPSISSLVDKRYLLVNSDTSSLLSASDEIWTFFKMGLEFKETLQQGVVTYEMREQFALNSIPLSANCHVSGGLEGPWTIKDDEYETIFVVTPLESSLEVSAGGQGFELQNYQFWKIRYYLDYEKWIVVKENGLVSTYGGLKTKSKNTLQWGIKWGNWVGSSSLIEGQEQYAVAWNLSSDFNTWGDRVEYAYEVTEQRVGSETGKSYTKACYLSSITDVFKRTVSFYYTEKEINEFMDPYKAVPNNDPNAYQSRYESKYLHRVEVKSADDKLLYAFQFFSDVKNVTGRSEEDPLYLETSKRFLTEIIQENGFGESLPSVKFDYYFENTDPNPGALKSITNPQGGISLYTYRQEELPLCQKSITIERPVGEYEDYWIPRVWYGSDYAVVAWYNKRTYLLQVSIYTWLGYWYQWTTEKLNFEIDLDVDSLNVLPTQNSFSLSYKRTGVDSTTLLLAHKVHSSLGKWIFNEEPINYPYRETRVKIYGGDGFFIVFDTDNSSLDRYTWDWRYRVGDSDSPWQKETFSLSEIFGTSDERDYYLSTYNNYYIILSHSPNRLGDIVKIFTINNLGNWLEGGTSYPEDIQIISNNFFWTLGDTFAVATYVTTNASSFYKYDIQILHWDENYQFLSPVKKSNLQVDKAIQFIPVLVGNNLLGSGPYLFRFNGQDWQQKEIDLEIPVKEGNLFWFAYAGGLGLVTQNSSSRVISLLAVYDPNTDSLQWNSEPLTLEDQPPMERRQMSYFPTATSEFISVGKKIYYRGTSSNWVSSIQTPIYEIPSEEIVNTTTVYNQSPKFFSYLQFEDDGRELKPLSTIVLNLENGAVKNIETFEEQIYQLYDSQGYMKSNLNGKIPVGPDMLTTYGPIDEEDFDNAEFITLRRCLNAAVEGRVTDYSVVSIEVNDGFDKTYLCYDYDLDTAVCDPSGKVIKYYKVRTYAGCKDKSESKDGYTETVYINGLPGETPGISYAKVSVFNNAQENYSVLDGFIEFQNTYDAEDILVASQQSEWLVKAQKLNEKGEMIPIRGYYSLLKRSISMLGNVETVSESSYDLFSGQMTTQTTTNYNSRGKLEEWTQETTYGYQKYPLLGALNMLAVSVSTKTQVVEDSKIAIPTCSVTRLKPWTRTMEEGSPPLSILAVNDNYQWLGGENEPNFTAWSETETPGPEWQRGSTITARTNQGLNLEVQDIMNKYASSLYDKNYQYLIADFANARILEDEADYLGFEAYEQERGWKIMPSDESWGLYVDSTTAHTGKRCLKLSSSTTGSNALEKTFTPLNQDTKYLFTFWYKTSQEFSQNDEEAGCKITLIQNGREVHKIILPFENTILEWNYVSQAIDLEPYTAAGTTDIYISLYNQTNAVVFLDNLRFSPFLGTFSASVYSQSYGMTTASLGPNKETFRNVYDNFQAPVATIGPDENVSGITFQYYSRQKDDVFSPAMPNSLVTISGMEKGFYSDFRRDGTYTLHWDTEEQDQWTLNEGTLLHTGPHTGKIYLNTPIINQKYAAYVIANPREEITAPLGIMINEDTSIYWNPVTSQWHLKIGENIIESPPQPQGMQREWALAIYDKIVLFFANGEMIFSTTVEENIEGKFGLFAQNTVDFSRIILSNEFQIAISYSDGADKERQSQLLFEGGSIINQPMYDYLGRAAVSTKSAKISPNQPYPLLSYRPDFVTSLDWDTGIMSGEVNNYYSLEGEGPSNDEGYPYSRSRFESSPLSRVIEQGIPGKDFAIVDLSTTTPEERHTTKISYFPNSTADGFMSWLPEGQYFVTQTINPDGDLSLILTDQSGNLVSQGILVDKDPKKYNMTSYQTFYSNFGQKTLTLLPNYYDPPNVEYKDKWQATTDYDMLANAISSEGPDGGKVETIYDLSGAVRFSQNSEGRDKGYYSYVKYDETSRVIEDGIIEGAWDPARLQDYAHNNPSWPTTPSTWGRKLTYDGEGSHPYLMGQLASVVVHGELESPNASNQQIFEYNIAGQVIKQTLEVFKENSSYSTFYSYNNKSTLTHVIYPSTSPEAIPYEYTYTYNQGGVLESIYSPTMNINYASYLYNADGSLKTETLVNSLPARAERQFEYISPGWLKKISDPYFTQEMYYTKDSSGHQGYYSGLIVEEKFNLLSTTALNSTPSYAYRYTYDVLGQLITAENQVSGETNPQWSIGINGSPLTYDSNGNFLHAKKGDIEQNYTYNSGTDEVKNTKGDQSEGYQYNLIGATTAAEEKGITSIIYDRASGRETLITTNSEEIKFEYNSSNQRILKSTTALSKLYLHGLSSNPLVEKISRDSLSGYEVTYVYGSTGLIGFIKENIFYLVVSDRQGSTRALINPEGTLEQAYTYLPFGGFMDVPGETDEAMPYLYTSQEWDNETKLYNYKARFYDPQMGRFFSTDAAGEFASPYIYCGNNPIMFTDPSGNMSGGAIFGIAVGVTAIAVGIGVTVATAGAGASVAIGGALAAGALIGGGSSSVGYSAGAGDDWNPAAWAGSTIVGAGIGAASAGIGVKVGVSAAATGIRSMTGKSIAKIGAGVVAGAAGDAAVSVVGTMAYNGMSGESLASGLGGAAIGGALGSVMGVGMGSIAGSKLFKKYRRGHAWVDPASRNTFSNAPNFNQAEDLVQRAAGPRHGGGVVGIWHSKTGEINLGHYTSDGTTGGFGPSHAQQARGRYGKTRTEAGGEYAGKRNIIKDNKIEKRATYPNLRGFNLLKTGSNSADIGFTSITLNGYIPNSNNIESNSWLNSSGERMQILTGLRTAGISVSIQRRYRGMDWSPEEIDFLKFS